MRYRLAAVLLIGGMLVVGCRQSRQGALDRPEGVPAQAFRIGGAEGGVYVALSKAATDPAAFYRGSVFEEHSGALWYKGPLKLVPADSPPIDIKDASLFSGWDGDALLLKDGRKLVAQR
jgi:hypothetical protein